MHITFINFPENYSSPVFTKLSVFVLFCLCKRVCVISKDRALLRAGFIARLPSPRWEGLLPVELCSLDLWILVVNGKLYLRKQVPL